jgi:hypothetical protein
MPTRLIQFREESGAVVVAAIADDGMAHRVHAAGSTYELASEAIAGGRDLAGVIAEHGLGEGFDARDLLRHGRLLAPIAHPDPAHLLLTGTGLTHLGSAEGRDKMHRAASAKPEELTDSLRMFRMGLEGGKPGAGEVGVQPEWFYKGDGSALAGPNQPLTVPAWAKDGGEEPEIAGIYLIGPDGTPHRLGFALGNEFSDHVTERGNYLWLAHSKLRQAALGPEILIGALPEAVVGRSRILRGGEVVWEKPFLSGEAHMSHTIANLEHHHFKYDLFRRPGDIHVHFFGTATLSFSDGIKAKAGDVFEIAAAPFTLPARNPLSVVTAPEALVAVRAL